MRRQCGRPGCSVVATVTFSFDATRCVVWLDDIADGTARAGDLCTRHANALVPPKGWERVDRRSPVPAAAAPTPLRVVPPIAPAPAAPRRPRRDPSDADASLFDEPSAPPVVAPAAPPVPALSVVEAPAPEPAPEPAPVAPAAVVEPAAPAPEPAPAPAPGGSVSWLPRNATEEDLDSVLSASSPLLSRAFRNARGDGAEPEPDERVDPDAF